jgi:hypothetical protein
MMNTQDIEDLKSFCAKLDRPEFGLSGDTYMAWMMFIMPRMEKLMEIDGETEMMEHAKLLVGDVKAYTKEHLFTQEFQQHSDPAITLSKEEADAFMLPQTQFASRAEFYRQFILPTFTAAKKASRTPPFSRSGFLRKFRKFVVGLFFGKQLRMADIIYGAMNELEIHFSLQT